MIYSLKLTIPEYNTGNGRPSVLAHMLSSSNYRLSTVDKDDVISINTYTGMTHKLSVTGHSKESVVNTVMSLQYESGLYCIELLKILGHYLKGDKPRIRLDGPSAFSEIGIDVLNMASLAKDHNPEPTVKRKFLSSKKTETISYAQVGNAIFSGDYCCDSLQTFYDRYIADLAVVLSNGNEFKTVFMRREDMNYVVSVNSEVLNMLLRQNDDTNESLLGCLEGCKLIGAKVTSSTHMHEGIIEDYTVVGIVPI